ncbi:hypothetical protein BAUCODRAFT_62174 [Baudoinia panamericana UAMH 10762]|uniref:Uncharacterized protein n=1 Tax=Baudoinia panamericana (strain UAMH 10762) TaxID=717646 RepID=M2NN25_BAUPA|nr:uncharacterized protein BAUCODRAFT_62174 [Baudoinia panamericana UAMH 10762]EMD00920.1 hypothetical protein BAUCODRAFT_62174 [Baudoinia panamericana UAMH 10762]
MLPEQTPSPQAPNKLVKRASSVHSAGASPVLLPGSKIPRAVFRRPATSHQRSATLVESSLDRHQTLSTPSHHNGGVHGSPWRQYFTSKVARDESVVGRRRSSSSIPNPVRRVYPDRKYTPVLVSTHELLGPLGIKTDHGRGARMAPGESVASLAIAPSAASSPLPVPTTDFAGSVAPRRSFSIGDLLSSGPQPLWKRPTPSKRRPLASKTNRKPKSRVTSAPSTSMGSTFSSSASQESERPTKRRDLTDPQAIQRSIYTSSSDGRSAETQHREIDLHLGSPTPLSLQLPSTGTTLGTQRSHATTPSPSAQRRLPSADLWSSVARQAHASSTQSEITSTPGSDSEPRSAGGYSTDYQNEHAFDSYPTRTTRSSSGKRGPPIDTIFDESPPNLSSGRSTKLRDFLNEGRAQGSERSGRYRHSTIEEEGSVTSTPIQSGRDKNVTSTPSARPGTQLIFTSSPPTMPDPDEIDWDAPEDRSVQQPGLGIQAPANGLTSTKTLPFRLGALSRAGNLSSVHSTPNRHSNGGDKANPFDWSEQQPSPSNHDQSPPRPRTVHGKKDDTRGSRANGRRPPSGMHARSHSVPVVPEAGGKRSVAASKFGTWGVGSKAVTEDWNEDFDFEDTIPSLPEQDAYDDRRIDSGHEMFVPKSIREQQHNVVANIEMLREWGLLIEELKDLRLRAVAVGMLNGPHAQAWQEVDAMIELADQESEELTLQPRRSPPSSPGFDYDAFEDTTPSLEESDSVRSASFILPEPLLEREVQATALTTDPSPNATEHPYTARPRKDSEAVARLVIEALQTKRSVSDSSTLKPVLPSKKVPFDTATLRHIVPYVNGLKRKVKDALRETEGLYSSPRRRSPPDDSGAAPRKPEVDPPFHSIFKHPRSGSPTGPRKSRRDDMITDNDGFEVVFGEGQADLADRFSRLGLPS